MDSDGRKVEFVDRSGLSSFTFRLKDVQPPAVPPAWRSASQPAKLLFLSLLIMSCLCGSLYYGTMSPGPAKPQGRSVHK